MKSISLSIFLTLLFSAGIFAQQGIKIGSTAPAFVGTDIDGSPVSLSAFEGKVVVMTFWSTRCVICHNELPKLNAMATRFDLSKVAFLALSMENEDKIASYLEKNKFVFRIIPNSFGIVLQYADRDRLGNLDMGFPSIFVIDRRGIISYRTSGYGKVADVEKAIDRLAADHK